MEELAKPTEIYGEIHYRDQAADGLQLWTLSGRQTLALEQADGDKIRMRNYIRDVSEKAKQVEKSKTCRWRFICRD